jgi:hypothetical protein
MALVSEWNEVAHPFNWTSKSVAKVMAKRQIEGMSDATIDCNRRMGGWIDETRARECVRAQLTSGVDCG